MKYLAPLALAGLAACTPTQQATTTNALICALNVNGSVIAVSQGSGDTAANKALFAAAAAGAVVATDAACQAALRVVAAKS